MIHTFSQVPVLGYNYKKKRVVDLYWGGWKRKGMGGKGMGEKGMGEGKGWERKRWERERELSTLFTIISIFQPLAPGAILYPGRCSAWQPVVTSMPSMVEVPKESIIANTDFTTTSVIAKR